MGIQKMVEKNESKTQIGKCIYWGKALKKKQKNHINAFKMELYKVHFLRVLLEFSAFIDRYSADL